MHILVVWRDVRLCTHDGVFVQALVMLAEMPLVLNEGLFLNFFGLWVAKTVTHETVDFNGGPG